MKNILLFTLVLSLSPLSFANSLKNSVKNLSKLLENPEPSLDCNEDPLGDVEKSEVKIMYPCSVWEENKTILDKITKKKEVYKSVDGRLLTDAEVSALTPDQKEAAEKKVLIEESDIVFSKLTPASDKVVVRSRVNNTTGEEDFTIKLRPMEPTKLITTGLKKENIKCERDVSSVTADGELKPQAILIANRATISCSHTIDNMRSEDITSAASESNKFLSLNGITITKTDPYKAIKSEKRALKSEALGFLDAQGNPIKVKISLEKWQVPGLRYPQGCFLELSAKSPVAQMSQIGADLKEKFETKLGVKFDKNVTQGNKTGQALKLMEN